MADRKFLDFLDMIDGGGAGQMGDKFEGGGLYSVLGNLVGSPYGSKDEERKKARMAAYGSDNIGGPPLATPPPVGTVGGGAPAPVVPPTPQEPYGSANIGGLPMQIPPPVGTVGASGRRAPVPPPIPQEPYGGRGSVGMPYPEWVQDDLTRQTIDYLRQAGVSGY